MLVFSVMQTIIRQTLNFVYLLSLAYIHRAHSAELHSPLLQNTLFSFQLKLGSSHSPLRQLNNCPLASTL